MRTQAQAGNLRGLKALVIFMGVLIILGTALVIGVVVHRLTAGVAAASVPGASVPMAGMAPPAAGVLAPGEHVSAIAAAGSALGVWVSGPAGDRVLLIDPASGRVSEALRSAPSAGK